MDKCHNLDIDSMQCKRFILIHLCQSVTYILWSIDFVLDLEAYLMDECCTEDIDSV